METKITKADKYLVDIPQESAEWGLCKILLVRREMIHIKHILNEIYLRKTISLDFPEHMEEITQKIRRIFKFSRSYRNEIDKILDLQDHSFFRMIDLYKGLKVGLVLDFDGTVTANQFQKLYPLCLERTKTFIVSANPTVNFEWFDKKGLERPSSIAACRGMEKKKNMLVMLNRQYDVLFYVDNETKYLDFAWTLGVKTFHWTQNKIKFYTRKTK